MTTTSLPTFTAARHLVAAAGLILACLTTAACSQGKQLSTHAAGHTIGAQIRGDSTTVEGHADGALLGSEFGKVRVERSRMRIEGEGWVKIAEDAPVTVSIQRGRIRLTAGKVSVGRTVSD
jgi:hypothetical protein